MDLLGPKGEIVLNFFEVNFDGSVGFLRPIQSLLFNIIYLFYDSVNTNPKISFLIDFFFQFFDPFLKLVLKVFDLRLDRNDLLMF